MASVRARYGKTESAFAIYLRTGRRAVRGVEVKFNPWHDPRDGRFTFAGQGQLYPNGYVAQDRSQEVSPGEREAAAKDIRDAYGGRRQPSARDPYVPDYSDSSPWSPKNWRVYVVRRGDSLTSIAQMRKGLTVDFLAGLNRIPKGKLRIGQMLMLPTQRSLDEGRDARSKFMALGLYMDTHGGKLPPDPANPPSVMDQVNETYSRISKNGYQFEFDLPNRMKRLTGTLGSNPAQGRSRVAQRIAGMPDRLSTDEGGHFVARRFNGPTDLFNHFAQDRSFNRSAYASLEKRWDKIKAAGQRVDIDIRAIYEGLSRRPSLLVVRYYVDGKPFLERFPNDSSKSRPR